MQSGLKLNRGFDVPAGGSADFTIDFDLHKSVHMTGSGSYMLRPTLRMVDNIMVGSISGTVGASLVPSGYTIAFTCDADRAVDDALTFTGTATVPISANTTTTHNI